MKTPEEITLIGGGILLSSGLVFGVKSGAATTIPKVSHSVDTVLQGKKNADSSLGSADSSKQKAAQQKQQQEEAQKKQQDEQKQAFANSFEGKYQQAQQKHWQTGTWGSAQFYVDDNENMHVGGDQLQGSFSNVVNDQQIKTINLDEDTRAPQDSSFLFADSGYNDIPLTQINGLAHLDTSQTTSMEDMFEGDSELSNLDVSHFDTRNVTNMYSIFEDDSSLSNLDVSHFDTHNVTNMREMFEDDSSLSNLDMRHFDTRNATDMNEMFDGDSIHQLTLGNNTKLNDNQDWNGTYHNGNQSLSTDQLIDSQAHPGTWYKQ